MINDGLFRLFARDVELQGPDLAHIEQNIQAPLFIAARTDVFRAGPSPHLHVLQGGWACKYKLLSDGRRQITAFHLPGDILDLDRIKKTELPFAVLALGACRVVRLSIDWLRQAIDERPAIRDLMWTLTTHENQALSEQIVSLGRRTARERVAYFFCDLLARLETIGDAPDGVFTSSIGQTEIADALGLSTVHLNRTLQALKGEGLLASKGRTYRVLDAPRLREIAMIER